MRKYFAFYTGNIKNVLAYRGPIVVWLASHILNLLVILAVWLVATGGSTFGGYTRNELITYYIIGLFLQWLAGWMPFYWIKDEIKDGTIVGTTLLKPFSLYWKCFFAEAGWHTVSLFVGLVASAGLAFLFRDYFVLIFPQQPVLLLLALVLCLFVEMGLSLCMGLLAFWFTHINAADNLYWACKFLFGGQGIPVSFLTGLLGVAGFILPFRYVYSFPLEVYFGKLSDWQIASGLGMQFVWAVAFFFLYRWMMREGTKAYTSFGN